MTGGGVAALVVLGVLVVAFGVVGGFGWGALVVMAELRPKGSTEGRLLRALGEMQTLHDAATRELVRRSVPPIDGSNSMRPSGSLEKNTTNDAGDSATLEKNTTNSTGSASAVENSVMPGEQSAEGSTPEMLRAVLDGQVDDEVPPQVPGRPPRRRQGPVPLRPGYPPVPPRSASYPGPVAG